jgi:perosamine synthetase
MRLHQRHRLDIGWSDLAAAALFCLRADEAQARGRIAACWPPEVVSVPCLSVRTAFDALLSTLAPAPGDEIVMSGVNIADMAAIAQAHGLTIRAIDVAADTLAPAPAAVAAALTPRTRLVLVAHLFGSRVDLAPFATIRRKGVLLVEDCAQAWSPEFHGSPEADVSLFSFGPIKTRTALGGAVAVFRDAAPAALVAARVGGYAPLGAAWLLRRAAKFAAMKAASSPLAYGLICRALAATGRDVETAMGALARGFGGGATLDRIRRRPPAALLALMARRLSAKGGLAPRTAAARALLQRLPPGLVPGEAAVEHSYWVTPIVVDDPPAVRRALVAAGFDATRGATSLRALGDARATPEAARMLDRILYLPPPLALTPAARTRLAQALAGLVAGRPAAE